MHIYCENRADLPATRLNPENQAQGTIDYDSEDFDENMLLNLDGIGIFGNKFLVFFLNQSNKIRLMTARFLHENKENNKHFC